MSDRVPDSATSSTAAPAAAVLDEAGEPIRLYNSRVKYSLLALVCFIVAIGATQGQFSVSGGGGEPQSPMFTAILVAIGLFCGGVLLKLAFEKDPVLVIDQDGIRCRRPNTGLIPWAAVAGLGLSRVSLVRSVLLIAIDESQLAPEALDRMVRTASPRFSKAARYFKGRMQSSTVLQIPIAYLAISPKKLRRLLEERVSYNE